MKSRNGFCGPKIIIPDLFSLSWRKFRMSSLVFLPDKIHDDEELISKNLENICEANKANRFQNLMISSQRVSRCLGTKSQLFCHFCNCYIWRLKMQSFFRHHEMAKTCPGPEQNGLLVYLTQMIWSSLHYNEMYSSLSAKHEQPHSSQHTFLSGRMTTLHVTSDLFVFVETSRETLNVYSTLTLLWLVTIQQQLWQ